MLGYLSPLLWLLRGCWVCLVFAVFVLDVCELGGCGFWVGFWGLLFLGGGFLGLILGELLFWVGFGCL